MSKSYVWERTSTKGTVRYYKTDVAVSHSCSDEAAESDNRSDTVIVWWDDE